MSEINLLNSNTKKTSLSSAIGSLMAKALIVVLVAAIVYYGVVLFLSSKTTKDISAIKVKIETDQQEILKNESRPELLTRQVQLKEAENIIKNHVYWSRFFKDMANATLKASSYGGFTVDKGGVIVASVLVSDYATLDQWLQVFDLPTYNKNFSDVKIVSISAVDKVDFKGYDARIKFTYNVDSLKSTLKK